MTIDTSAGDTSPAIESELFVTWVMLRYRGTSARDSAQLNLDLQTDEQKKRGAYENELSDVAEIQANRRGQSGTHADQKIRIRNAQDEVRGYDILPRNAVDRNCIPCQDRQHIR